ncbi:MAG TPA: hypothetical protein VFF67_05025 [Thermoplasmata archaeon]|nr:hypothetical protein [Thermoplasmata archaeon]
MRRVQLLPFAAGLLLLGFLVPAGASAGSSITGTASSCSGLYSCSYSLNGSAGSGSATTGSYGIAFRLPGEKNQTIGQFTASVVNRTGTIDRVQGSIFAIDANSGKIVFGSFDTYVNATAHCSRTGCYYTYKLVSGSITFQITRFDGTTTTVACTPSSISAGGSTKCTATVTDLANRSLSPTGNVSFTSSIGGFSAGSFANHGHCALVKGSCTLKFVTADNTAGTVSISAAFHGNVREYKSQGRSSISVNGN